MLNKAWQKIRSAGMKMRRSRRRANRKAAVAVLARRAGHPPARRRAPLARKAKG